MATPSPQIDLDRESTGFLLDLHFALVKDLDAFAYELSLFEDDYKAAEQRLVVREYNLREYLINQRQIRRHNLPVPQFIDSDTLATCLKAHRKESSNGQQATTANS